MKLVISVIFISGLLASVSTLDEESVKEQKCRKDVPTAKINKTWLNSVQRWYFPFVSKLKAYRYYSDILDKDIKDLTSAEIQNSCLNSDDLQHARLHAFNQRKEDNLQTRINPESTDIHFEGQHKNHSAIGDVHLAMTDNKSYLVAFTCWTDNEFSWNIVSVKPILEPEVKKKVFDLVKSMGFNVEDNKFYEEIKYNNREWIKSLKN